MLRPNESVLKTDGYSPRFAHFWRMFEHFVKMADILNRPVFKSPRQVNKIEHLLQRNNDIIAKSFYLNVFDFGSHLNIVENVPLPANVAPFRTDRPLPRGDRPAKTSFCGCSSVVILHNIQ